MDETLDRLERLIHNRQAPALPMTLRDRVLREINRRTERPQPIAFWQWAAAAAAVVIFWCSLLIPNRLHGFAETRATAPTPAQSEAACKWLRKEFPELDARESRRYAWLFTLNNGGIFAEPD